jgi:type VI secretion system protein ImpF
MRYKRSLFDRLLADPDEGVEGMTLTYNIEQLRHAVARDVESLLNSRSAIDFEALVDYPNIRRSVACYGIRDFVGRVLSNSAEQRHIAASLSHAIQSFEPRLRHVQIEFHSRPGLMSSLMFTIKALLIAHPAAEPVAFDATMQPSLSRFSIVPSRFGGVVEMT